MGDAESIGDIAKAVAELDEWRTTQPDLPCTLYLATNRPLGGGVKLYRDAVAKGREHNVTVEIIERSRRYCQVKWDWSGGGSVEAC